MSRSHLNAGAEMAISIETGKSGENEASHSSICPSQPFAMLRDDHLRAGDHDEPDPLLLLHDGERAAWQVLRDLPSVWEQERSKSPLGLLYSRQVGCDILGYTGSFSKDNKF